ncbi:MAG: hypothetical protein ACOX3T_03060 [Bdellovibrionota bacterium]
MADWSIVMPYKVEEEEEGSNVASCVLLRQTEPIYRGQGLLFACRVPIRGEN